MKEIDYTALDTPVLIKMLARHTEDYTRIISENRNRGDLEQLQKTIDAIQSAIGGKKPDNQDANPASTPAL